MKGRSGNHGFTLVEVLAAMALLAIVLPVVMRGTQIALRASSIARHEAEAASLGQAKLNEMIAEGTSKDGSGDFGADWPDYRWECQSISNDLGVTEMDMTVTWNEGGQARSLKIATAQYDNGAAGGIVQ